MKGKTARQDPALHVPQRSLSRIFAVLMTARVSCRKGALRRVLDRIDPYGYLRGCPDGRSGRNALFDLFYSRWFYSVTYVEYFLFGLDKSGDPDRLDAVGRYGQEHYYRILNETGRPESFDSKKNTYEVFREYFRRELLYISSPDQKEDFLSFFRRHGAGILKPDDRCGGKGIGILRLSDCRDPAVSGGSHDPAAFPAYGSGYLFL